jgi:hypothetical protein
MGAVRREAEGWLAVARVAAAEGLAAKMLAPG